MMNSTGKSLIPFLGLAGLILAVGFILYQAGYRITTATPPSPNVQQLTRQPGQHKRRQAMAEGKTGAQESAGGKQSGRALKRAGRGNSGRAAEIRSGSLGTEKIPVIGKGKEQTFTGADLEKLQQTTIASGHGLRAGWRLVDVLKHLTIAQGNEVVLQSSDGKTLNLPWEKIASREPTLLLSYNEFGGLMLFSGKEVTPEEIKGMDNRDVKELSRQYRAQSTSFSKINRIEVKG